VLVHVLRSELEELVKPQTVKKERRQNRPIAWALEGGRRRRGQKHTRLAVADGEN